MRKRILRPGRNCFISAGVRDSGLLVDGRDYYLAFHHAALRAEKYIFISGWQFDSEVTLLRGDDLKDNEDTRLLRFLNGLCEKNRDLRIYILAWDFSLIFMLEREWMQEWVFNWTTSDRLSFQFDNRHPLGASQHQKYAVIDGAAAFVGGLDICSGRWDDRRHLYDNPDRINPDGTVYEPYHDIQCYVTGEAASRLADLFAARWKDITGSSIKVAQPARKSSHLPGGVGLPIRAGAAALSRTHAKSLSPLAEPVKEIAYLYTDAILSAKRLIYLENQYLSSYAVFKALAEKLESHRGQRLQVVIILPNKPHGFLEELSVGVTQTRLLSVLKQTAQAKGHSLGIYYTQASENGLSVPVYIHSKLMIVDDIFLTMGSANTTNRSLGLDAELNVSWEATNHLRHGGLKRSIRDVRADLLREHTGLDGGRHLKKLKKTEGLVEYLDSIADKPPGRLCRHKLDLSFSHDGWVASLGLEDIILDPGKAVVEENIFELLSMEKGSLFSEGITYLKNWLLGKKGGFF